MPKQYTTINGHEKYDQNNYENHKVDFKKFFDPKSNRIQFKVDALLKLLPYDGFYPQERTKQIAGIFNDVYLDSTGLVTDRDRAGYYSEDANKQQAVQKTLAITQPLFSPGILFNTIKAGIACDWSAWVCGADAGVPDIYASSNTDTVFSINGESNLIKLPFETLINPNNYFPGGFSNKKLFYLNPTVISREFRVDPFYEANIPSISYQDINALSQAPKSVLYKSAINNFLYETCNFFLDNGQLTSFQSKTFREDESIIVLENVEYCMDLIIKKHPNFSMFNQYEYSSSYGFIPSASLFGPPICITDADGVPTNMQYHDTAVPYQPYTPPYYRQNDEGILRLTFKPSGIDGNNPIETLNLTLDEIKITFEDITDHFDLEISQNITGNTARNNRMTLESCMNFNLSSSANNRTYFIQTKFETPLINFNRCSYVNVTSSAEYYSWY